MTSPLVSTDWLAAHLTAPDVLVLDASLHLPGSGRDANAEYLQEHIPGAVRFDIDAISDKTNPLPHMLPAPHVFSSMMRKLGIGDGMTLVVYDSLGLFSAARGWWMLKTMGAARVFVLDGGLPKWKAEGRPVEDGAVRRPERHFTARLNHGAVTDLADMRRIVESGARQVVDARSAERFAGTAPEPRPGLRSGHMPGALNTPIARFLNADGTVKDEAGLRAVFAEAGVDLARPVTTSCGSGVTAAVVTLALTLLGHRDLSLYDGSWSEWGGLPDAPVVTG
ncbi:3-mercaptopyruvate sulfurtransferase [Pannonibacter tanglangensis]|uniref:3-mercaptopyruvate sulfurtransferase n=1 Tax=Pannonibacter tanglangensis TaxID=2750084 RepID=A0ABW9ZCN0_9HYPH|nr:3-mercaptopyruvate sulfurtransferase [Pannonibacter sp. XCT-34]NBN62418.1 3-mercaptopyruvate sulfurtransferase [Pannonibacter sp. XCT-34]